MLLKLFANTEGTLTKHVPFGMVTMKFPLKIFGGGTLKNGFTDPLGKLSSVKSRLPSQTPFTCDMFNPGTALAWQ
jgi:hypothetical protein